MVRTILKKKKKPHWLFYFQKKSHWIILIAFDCVFKSCLVPSQYPFTQLYPTGQVSLGNFKKNPKKKSETNKAEEGVEKDCCLVLLDLLNYIVWRIGHLHQRREQQPLRIPDREWRPCLTEKNPKTIRHSRLRM